MGLDPRDQGMSAPGLQGKAQPLRWGSVGGCILGPAGVRPVVFPPVREREGRDQILCLRAAKLTPKKVKRRQTIGSPTDD